MNKFAIDDMLDQSLTAWYGEVSLWMPDSSNPPRFCQGCHGELAPVIDPQAWPHELVESLAAMIDRVVRQLTESDIEDSAGDPVATVEGARSTVMAALTQHRGDIADVLEQCVRYRLDAFEMLERELAQLVGF